MVEMSPVLLKQSNRQLYDVLTKGSSDARQNPLHFIITTAGTDRQSIAYELHTKAVDILEGRYYKGFAILRFVPAIVDLFYKRKYNNIVLDFTRTKENNI